MVGIGFTLLVSWAAAANYTAEIAVTSQYVGDGQPSGVRRDLAVVGGPNQTATTADPRVTCGVQNGNVYAQFSASAQDWPTSWPVVATCTAGGHALTVSVVPMDAAVDFSLQPSQLVNGNTFVFTRPQTASVAKSVPLPAGSGPFTPGLYAASLDGVMCRVGGEAPNQHVAVLMAHASQTGTGKCALPRTGSGAFSLALQLDSGPY